MGGMIAQELALGIPGPGRARSCSARPRRAAAGHAAGRRDARLPRAPRRGPRRRGPLGLGALRLQRAHAQHRAARASARTSRAAARTSSTPPATAPSSPRPRLTTPRRAWGRSPRRRSWSTAARTAWCRRPTAARSPRAIPGARLLEFDDAAHLYTTDEPGADEAVREFLAGRRRGPGLVDRREEAATSASASGASVVYRWPVPRRRCSRPCGRRLGDQVGVGDGHDAVVLAVDDEGGDVDAVRAARAVVERRGHQLGLVGGLVELVGEAPADVVGDAVGCARSRQRRP